MGTANVLCLFYTGYAGNGCPTSSHSYPGGLRNVTCNTPFRRPGCFPVLGPSGNIGTDYNRSSGWTTDGRALHSIAVALTLQPGQLAFPAPCLFDCASTGTAVQGNSTTPPVCFLCSTVGGTAQIDTLDLTHMVALGLLSASNLRLVPQIGQLTQLRVLRASGIPMQGRSTVLLLCCMVVRTGQPGPSMCFLSSTILLARPALTWCLHYRHTGSVGINTSALCFWCELLRA